MAKDSATTPKAMPKSAVYKEIAERTELQPKQVAAVFEALEKLIKEQLTGKKSPGLFAIPNLVKFKLTKKPATKAGKRMVAGREVVVAAKPASTKVKAVILKSLKEVNK
jgi:nucleoid DNA-binding protein